eukprot:7378673-Prymnesium_polylepis.1
MCSISACSPIADRTSAAKACAVLQGIASRVAPAATSERAVRVRAGRGSGVDASGASSQAVRSGICVELNISTGMWCWSSHLAVAMSPGKLASRSTSSTAHGAVLTASVAASRAAAPAPSRTARCSATNWRCCVRSTRAKRSSVASGPMPPTRPTTVRYTSSWCRFAM